MVLMEEFYEILNDPYAYGRKCKAEKGSTIIGYFCSYTPEEIICAAGAHPMRLFGTRGDISLADAHLQTYSCSLVRGALEEALRGRLDFLNGTVFPHTCDSIQRLSDIWRLNTEFGFFADVVLPVKLDTESARRYMEDVLHKFKRDLEKGLGRTITDSDMNVAIEKYNEIRECLGTIYQLRSEEPGIISGSNMYTIIKGSMIMDRDDLLEKLPALVEHIQRGEMASDTADRKRIVLVGSICDHPDVYRVLEASDAVVVWDDLCTGSRYFEGTIATAGDPVAAVARRYIERSICPAKHLSMTARGDKIVEIVRSHSADGVVFLLLKFCDPHAFDYPYMKEYLDKAGIPTMLLEVEDQLPAEGQLHTRFETFVQML